MPSAKDRLCKALSGRYRVDRELGRGGMAVVYLAHDLKHDRAVAVKALKPEITGYVSCERFAREIRIAAQLQHPHICSVYDSGEVEGQPTLLYYVMPFVEGESLRSKLDRVTRLPVTDAVRITREAALALEHAHRHDVIHRDIKPENILLTDDGTCLVADFGIALALSDTTIDSGSDSKLTDTGIAIGTPQYMSPEQRLALQLDARSDIYSLSATLYEMLTGRPVHSTDAGVNQFLQRMTDSHLGLQITRGEMSKGLEAIIRKGLAANPDERFRSMRALRSALASEVGSNPPAAFWIGVIKIGVLVGVFVLVAFFLYGFWTVDLPMDEYIP